MRRDEQRPIGGIDAEAVNVNWPGITRCEKVGDRAVRGTVVPKECGRQDGETAYGNCDDRDDPRNRSTPWPQRW
jgi:hypothetical protein